LISQQLEDEVKSSNRAITILTERLARLESSIDHKPPPFETCHTFREGQENIPTNVNMAEEISKYSSTQRQPTGVDRADLLIM
jgi:hypothetical protein